MGYRRQSEYVQFGEDPFTKSAQGVAKIMHEVFF